MKRMEKMDLKPSQAGVLFSLKHWGEQSQKQLAERVGITPPSMTVALRKMEEKGYVTTYQIGKYSYINYLIEEQDYKEQELEKTKNFWYKESGFELVKTLYKGKLNEGKLKKLKKLLEEIDD